MAKLPLARQNTGSSLQDLHDGQCRERKTECAIFCTGLARRTVQGKEGRTQTVLRETVAIGNSTHLNDENAWGEEFGIQIVKRFGWRSRTRWI